MQQVFCFLQQRRLGRAFDKLQDYIESHHGMKWKEDFDKLYTDYSYMLSYMQQGYNDPQRETLYTGLLKKTMRLALDIELERMLQESATYSNACSRVRTSGVAQSDVRQQMENFVTEMAMLQLDTEDVRCKKEKELYKQKYDFMAQVFDLIVISPQWKKNQRQQMAELLLSPTIDMNDAALMVSAITLSLLNFFDPEKYDTLIDVYEQSSDTVLRQRALVGWAVTTFGPLDCFIEQRQRVMALTRNEEVRKELLQLQMQMFYCLNAEKDHDEIQRDIMPNIMKNSQFSFSRGKLIEKEDDPMQDILDPEAADKAMEEMENSIQKMMDMQKSGSDIYFGGFSQMKRFAFFFNLANWLMPFSIQHPALDKVRQKMGNSLFLEHLMSHGPFCDSDKYSFALAMETVIDRIPKDMQEMLGTQTVFEEGNIGVSPSDPAYVRRMYLQDLYRFFRVSHDRDAFRNPFEREEQQGALFLDHDFFCGMDGQEKVTLTQFLLRQKQMTALKTMVMTKQNTDNAQLLTMRAACLNHDGQYEEAMNCYQKAWISEPDNAKARRAYANLAFRMEQFALACEQYQWLAERSNRVNDKVNYCVCLVKLGQAKQAQPIMFKLYYEHAEDRQVARVLAWTLLASKRSDETLRIYDKIAPEEWNTDDMLNVGYAEWVEGHTGKAVDLFRKVNNTKKLKKENAEKALLDDFRSDASILALYGLSDTDMILMADLASSEAMRQ